MHLLDRLLVVGFQSADGQLRKALAEYQEKSEKLPPPAQAAGWLALIDQYLKLLIPVSPGRHIRNSRHTH